MHFTIHYDDLDTTPERLKAMAEELGLTPEELIHQAIDKHMGGYGLKTPPPGFEAKSLHELFVAHGVQKP
ncbi:hypothetical protein [Simplicispira suum]|uniref:Uncharacterized protein n=1 Tax=Simplicispira suum TaxID=2109915 RepID=A0A2S0N5S0_9BURK|nr:hypothetical protein [Simplicispira suum]AVO43475.1 hypothetical protein C6571_18805 [Simplicispira suum]